MVNVEHAASSDGFVDPSEMDTRLKEVKVHEIMDDVKKARLTIKLTNMTPENFYNWLCDEVSKENSTRKPEDSLSLERAFELIDSNFGSPEGFKLSDFLPE